MLERLLPTTLTLTALVALAGCGDSSSTGTTSTGSGTCDPGSGCPSVKSDCIGLVDNSTSSKFALRISHLALTKPTQLATATVRGLLDGGIDLNLPSCLAKTGDKLFPTLDTTGAFSWILEFDKSTGMLRTGGATPVEDPTQGYCFVGGMVAGLSIAPLQVPAPISADGKFSVTMPEDVVVPVYSTRKASDVILLPLKGVTIQGAVPGDTSATISSDNNCIGTFNAANLLPGNSCLSSNDPPIPQFVDGAGLTAYMDLEQADAVIVPQVQQSLCVLLSGDAATYGDSSTPAKKCKRTNGKIDFPGDWCGATNAAASGTCSDAIHLEATFAASSVQVRTDCP